jgi:hypothetical protein
MISYRTAIARREYPLVAIDLGYSRSLASCGIMHSGMRRPATLLFGATVKEAVRLVEQHDSLVLIFEAVLSTYHDEHGNPDVRGYFEEGRGWYYGPGVATYAAASRFLTMLRRECTGNSIVYLAEAFLSFKERRSRHSDDAFTIFRCFWDTPPENLKDGTEPILDFIEGVPSVNAFSICDSRL